MHSKTLAVLFLSALAAAEVEKRQDAYDDYYNSLMSQLNSLETDTNYMDYLTAYSDLPTDYSAYLPGPTDSPSTVSNLDSNNFPSMTAGPSITMPSGLSADLPPPSIQSVLVTAVPMSFLSQIENPSARSSIFSEIHNGHYPSWYQDLPNSVKDWVSSHYATATGPMPTGVTSSGGSSSNSNSGSGVPGAAAPSGMIATGLMGAAAILAVAVML
ncbi:hypothetical protein PENARI_c007G11721 [Penicillium arizonense]|uniref:Uncharacterized protein n=1 Tax=Penicillium arizonense TaxID=1835702 RepID=A0A1F5LK50_PENAI|nr:hypothetical protein PENARI_c007G11721 [Penicillium arizonense]OGE53495.1 hypothetical protein PENARI_c007G11721 [Penicillium arizonense]